MEAANVKSPQPIVLVRGQITSPKDAFLCIEGQKLCELPLEEVPFILLCSFFVFNIQYTNSCTNLFSFLEYIFLELTLPKRTKLQHFVTSISSVKI